MEFSQPPNFKTLSKIEEDLLVAKLDAIRKSISHSGEKGRALEHQVRGLLRDFLPAEYGLSTGFVLWHSPDGIRLSRQLDIVIYDAIRSGPLVQLSTCDVFPLEAVYGYVEVKATLRSSSDAATKPADDSIEMCVRRNVELRGMSNRIFWAPLGGSPVQVGRVEMNWLSLRSYVVAFEPVGAIASDLQLLATRLAAELKRAGSPAHLHGVFIPGHGFLLARPVDGTTASANDLFHVLYTADHPMLAFKTSLLLALATFPRPQTDWAPAIDSYFDHHPSWQKQDPRSISE